jgi:hypothetical protein
MLVLYAWHLIRKPKLPSGAPAKFNRAAFMR